MFLALFGLTNADDNFDRHVHMRNRLLERHPRDVKTAASSDGAEFGQAASFGRRNVTFIRLNLNHDKMDAKKLLNEDFTLMFWVKPEGGQYRLTPIIGMYEDLYFNIYKYIQ